MEPEPLPLGKDVNFKEELKGRSHFIYAYGNI